MTLCINIDDSYWHFWKYLEKTSQQKSPKRLVRFDISAVYIATQVIEGKIIYGRAYLLHCIIGETVLLELPLSTFKFGWAQKLHVMSKPENNTLQVFSCQVHIILTF